MSETIERVTIWAYSDGVVEGLRCAYASAQEALIGSIENPRDRARVRGFFDGLADAADDRQLENELREIELAVVDHIKFGRRVS